MSGAILPATSRRTLAAKIAFALVALAALGVAGYAIVGYSTKPLGSLVHPAMRRVFEANRAGILIHIFASSVALLLGPFQFVGTIRRRWPATHRWMGRVYLGVGVLIGGFAGLYMAPRAFGGIVSHLGFGSLALAWLFTGAKAYTSIRAGNVQAHRAWMLRNFAMTFAAVTIRIGIGAGFVSGMRFEIFYPVLSWISWVPSLLVAEWIIRATRVARPSAVHA